MPNILDRPDPIGAGELVRPDQQLQMPIAPGVDGPFCCPATLPLPKTLVRSGV
jgi:hypothetical protein